VITDQLNRLIDGCSEQEIAKAKEYWKGRLMLRLENTQNVGMWYGAQELLLDKILEVEQTAALIDAVDVQDVNRVAKDLITKKMVNLAVVGPFKSEAKFQSIIDN
jgi:predicted Zn-dependent peptidase